MKMSLVAAPTDLRMPISRTRSEILASMIFMIPMPPTSRLMPAISPPLKRASWMNLSMFSAHSSCVRKEKSSMPRCVVISTLRTCCNASGRTFTPAIFNSRVDKRGSPVGAPALPLPPPLPRPKVGTAPVRNFIHIVFKGM